MHQSTISLIIPAHNEETLVAECLSYATRSSHGQFAEILVIDNASTDRTAEIALTFPGVRVVREDNKGLTRARQRGFKEARGDILAFVDADTRMPDGWAERVRVEFSRDPKLACLSGPYIYYDSSRFMQWLIRIGWWYLLAYPLYKLVGFMAVGGNFAIRKDIVERMGGFDTTIEFYGEDTNLARRAHEFGRVKFSLSFEMLTSGRRLHGQGIARTAFTYGLNFISEAYFRKPATSAYADIRKQHGTRT